MSFEQFGAREMYRKVRGLGDKLAIMKGLIDWRPFRPLVASVYNDNAGVGGRPHTDEVLIVRALLLQAWYGLSDEELEYQCNDRLSFRNFLDFPGRVPDFTTIWNARERLKQAGVENHIWAELQRQLDEKGFKVEKGVIQDASFIEAEQGRKRRAQEKKAAKQGFAIQRTPQQTAHIDKDGSYARKGNQVHYGYKLHTKQDIDHGLIRSLGTTTAKAHDATISLLIPGDVAAYRDKGYFGTPVPKGVEDHTMRRATRGHKLNGGQQRRNKRISRTRSPGERPYAVIKTVFHNGITFVTTLARVHIKNVFTCFAYNLYRLTTLTRHLA